MKIINWILNKKIKVIDIFSIGVVLFSIFLIAINKTERFSVKFNDIQLSDWDIARILNGLVEVKGEKFHRNDATLIVKEIMKYFRKFNSEDFKYVKNMDLINQNEALKSMTVDNFKTEKDRLQIIFKIIDSLNGKTKQEVYPIVIEAFQYFHYLRNE